MAKSWGKAAQSGDSFSRLFTSRAVWQSLYDTLSSVPPWCHHGALPLSAQVMHPERGIKFTDSVVCAFIFKNSFTSRRFTNSLQGSASIVDGGEFSQLWTWFMPFLLHPYFHPLLDRPDWWCLSLWASLFGESVDAAAGGFGRKRFNNRGMLFFTELYSNVNSDIERLCPALFLLWPVSSHPALSYKHPQCHPMDTVTPHALWCANCKIRTQLFVRPSLFPVLLCSLT